MTAAHGRTEHAPVKLIDPVSPCRTSNSNRPRLTLAMSAFTDGFQTSPGPSNTTGVGISRSTNTGTERSSEPNRAGPNPHRTRSGRSAGPDSCSSRRSLGDGERFASARFLELRGNAVQTGDGCGTAEEGKSATPVRCLHHDVTSSAAKSVDATPRCGEVGRGDFTDFSPDAH